jgi:hypothetical protein
MGLEGNNEFASQSSQADWEQSTPYSIRIILLILKSLQLQIQKHSS